MSKLQHFFKIIIFLFSFSEVYSEERIKNIELCTEDKEVGQIVFLTDINLSAKDLSSHFPYAINQRCEKNKLMQSLKVLENRNVFEEVKVQILERDGKLVVEYNLIPFLVLSRVQFLGNSNFTSSELLRVSGMKIGSNVFSEDIRESERRIKNLYHDNGYTDVALDANLIADRTSPLVSLEFKIIEGEANKVSKFEIEGLDDLIFEEIKKDLQKTFIGRSIKKNITNDIKKYTYQLLSTKGYPLASVFIDVIDGLNGIYKIKVNPKSAFKITFLGLTAFSEESLMSGLELETRTTPLRHSGIANWCDEIKNKYLNRGYLDVALECNDSEPSDVKIVINEGDMYENFRLEFLGNSYFSDRTLLNLIKTSLISDTFSLIGRKFTFSQNDQNAFIEVLKSNYISKGFLDAEVSSKFLKDTLTQTAVIKIIISEGKLYKVKNLVLKKEGEGVDDVDVRLESYFSKFKNKDYLVLDIASAVLSLEEELLNLGYYSSNLTPEYDKSKEILFINYKVEKPVKVRNIYISGNYFTVDKIILRELPFREGDHVNDFYLDKARTSLLGLGVFKSVEAYILQDNLTNEECDVQILVKERETGVVEALTEISTQDGLHLQGQVGQRNLFGTGRALIFSVDGYFKNSGVQNFDAARARAAYGSPKIYGSQLDYQLEGFLQSNLNLNRTFKYDRIGATNSLRFPFLEILRFSASHSFYTERLFDVNQDLVLGERDTGSTLYSGLKANIEYDKRDDPFVATKGYKVELGGGIFPEELGSDVSMYEAHSQVTNIIPLDSFWSYALNLRGAMTRTSGNDDVVPLGSRYFIGGRDSLRGYTRYQVGPRSNSGSVVGGDTVVTLNQEVRYQLSDQLRTFVFLDFGQSFLIDKADFSGDTKEQISDFKISPGIGAQYLTPIGPLGFEIGFATDREFGERWGRILLSIGTAF